VVHGEPVGARVRVGVVAALGRARHARDHPDLLVPQGGAGEREARGVGDAAGEVLGHHALDIDAVEPAVQRHAGLVRGAAPRHHAQRGRDRAGGLDRDAAAAGAEVVEGVAALDVLAIGVAAVAQAGDLAARAERHGVDAVVSGGAVHRGGGREAEAGAGAHLVDPVADRGHRGGEDAQAALPRHGHELGRHRLAARHVDDVDRRRQRRGEVGGVGARPRQRVEHDVALAAAGCATRAASAASAVAPQRRDVGLQLRQHVALELGAPAAGDRPSAVQSCS